MKKIAVIMILLVTMMTWIFAEARNALLIANGKYQKISKLNTPVSEAENLKKSLVELGFKVTIVNDATHKDMEEAIANFKKVLSANKGIGFFHYGGHAVQVKGINYLIPADADIPEERFVQTRAVSLDDVMASMKGEANIVVLDSCRDNPLPFASGKSASRGLAPTNHRPNNSIIVYSAQAGSTAQDGVFTPLLSQMITQSKSFTQIIRDVRIAVKEKTNNMQIPGSYDDSDNEIFLAGSVGAIETITMNKSKKEYEDLEKEIENIKAQMASKKTEKEKQKALEELQKKESAAKQKKMELEERQREIQAEAEKNHQPQESHLKFTGEADGMVKLNKGGKPYMIVCDHEVTQSEYESVMGYNPSFNKADGNLPVEMVSWYDAVKYCNKRSETEGLTPCYVIKGNNVTWNRAADGYRLPTVDEYKDAAGLSVGNTIINDDNAWTLNNSDNKTHIVKQKKSNSNKLYDMTGNVAEWCWSDNKSNKSYNVGAWNVPDSYSANIKEQPATNKNPALGFRVVRNADAADIAAQKYAEEETIRKQKEETAALKDEKQRLERERRAQREEEQRWQKWEQEQRKEQQKKRNAALGKDYNGKYLIFRGFIIASGVLGVGLPIGFGLLIYCSIPGEEDKSGCYIAGAVMTSIGLVHLCIALPIFGVFSYLNSPKYKREHSTRPTRNQRVVAGLLKTNVLMGYDYREDKACVGMSIKI